MTAVPSNSRVIADAPILLLSDTCMIAGCPFVVAGVPSPCLTVQWVVGTTRTTIGGTPALNESSVGLCLAATQAPQGTVMISATQAKVAGL